MFPTSKTATLHSAFCNPYLEAVEPDAQVAQSSTLSVEDPACPGLIDLLEVDQMLLFR